MGHLSSIAFPTLRNLTKNLGPRVRMFVFLRGRMGSSHIIPCAHLYVMYKNVYQTCSSDKPPLAEDDSDKDEQMIDFNVDCFPWVTQSIK